MLLHLLSAALGQLRPGTVINVSPILVAEALREARRIHPGIAATISTRLVGCVPDSDG